MDQRERFEAWYEAWSMPAESDWFRKEEDGEYFWPTTHNAWYAWQAAEAAALESAADMASIYLADHGIDQARECLPDAIRKLAAPVERGGE